MALKRISLALLATVFTATLFAVFFFQDLIEKARAYIKLGAVECKDDPTQAQQKENPNKMLFVSCGGFLE